MRAIITGIFLSLLLFSCAKKEPVACAKEEIDKGILLMKSEGMLYKAERYSDQGHYVYVTEAWYALSFDAKEAAAKILACYLNQYKYDEEAALRFHNYKSNKLVGYFIMGRLKVYS